MFKDMVYMEYTQMTEKVNEWYHRKTDSLAYAPKSA